MALMSGGRLICLADKFLVNGGSDDPNKEACSVRVLWQRLPEPYGGSHCPEGSRGYYRASERRIVSVGRDSSAHTTNAGAKRIFHGRAGVEEHCGGCLGTRRRGH